MTDPQSPLFHVVLIEPQIPQNTGNIGRTCVGTNSHLHIVEPIPFEITDKNLKRAGLDYWPHLKWTLHSSFAEFRTQTEYLKQRKFLFSAFGKKSFYEIEFQRGDFLYFGKETKGLPDQLLSENENDVYQIPIFGPVRGYNVATSVAIVVFEGIRQLHRGHGLQLT